jgi:hypothetical protein
MPAENIETCYRSGRWFPARTRITFLPTTPNKNIPLDRVLEERARETFGGLRRDEITGHGMTGMSAAQNCTQSFSPKIRILGKNT